ncbi:MAG: hypothetical protein GTN71_04870, partial [Anaerolineae bacterium]|nr:hypothetical protein [Gemmatimonadales bacterium]NIO68385.1 hypothetical protein [Anaerolineae bacterium]
DTPVVITLTGSDTESCELTFAILSPPSNGSLGTITNNACTPGSPNTDSATVTYTPDPDSFGPDSFSYRVTDADTDFDDASVSITVNSVNDLPTADDKAVATDEDTPVLITLSGSDVESCELSFATAGPTNGSLGSITNNACTPGSPNTDSATVTFTPNPGVCTPSQGSFTYTTNDGTDTSASATVTIDINCVP